ncbi:MAG: hypothetical protein R3C68_19595 [Myxococcota bacterium]
MPVKALRILDMSTLLIAWVTVLRKVVCLMSLFIARFCERTGQSIEDLSLILLLPHGDLGPNQELVRRAVAQVKGQGLVALAAMECRRASDRHGMRFPPSLFKKPETPTAPV